MFEHLDDPVPFVPSAALRRRVVERGRRRRRTRRVAVAAGGTAAALAAVGGAAVGGVQRLDRDIDRVDVAGPPSLDGAVNVLLVGSDRRSAGDPDAAAVAGARADVVMIVRLETDGGVRVLSLPRDLVGPSGRRLSTVGDGGVQDVVDAVTAMTGGVPIDHVVELEMAGLVELVDEVGPLRLAVDRPLRDPSAGLDLAPSACADLDGRTALALLRARHVAGGDSGDLGRIARQQAVATAVVDQLADVGDDPGAWLDIARVLADHVTVDEGFALAEMAELGRALAAAGPDRVRTATVPMVERGDLTLALAPEAAAVLAELGATGPAPTVPDVVVDPATGETVTGPPAGTGAAAGPVPPVDASAAATGLGPCPG